MKCSKCGFEGIESENFCPKCGESLRKESNRYEDKVEGAFEEIKQLTILFFKNPAALADKATNSSHNTGFVLGLMALILVAITSMLWSLKSGNIFNIFGNLTGLLSAIGTQLFTYILITVVLYIFLSNKFNNILDVFTIASIAYLPLVVLRFLGNLIQIVSIITIIPIGSALGTAGVAAFSIIIYKILVDNNLIENRKAFFISILIAFLA